MNTSDNQQSLYRIIDGIRVMSILLLLLHGYYYFYTIFSQWRLRTDISDRILINICRTGLFDRFHTSKGLSLLLLVVSLLGARGRKAEQLTWRRPLAYLASGLVLYFGSALLFECSLSDRTLAIAYLGVTLTGYLLILRGGNLLSRIIHIRMARDIFNADNETFPQEERRIVSEFHVNLPIRFRYQRREWPGWINIYSLRGLLIMGSPGSGKSWYIIQHIIRQQIAYGYAMFIYDFKYDDLSRLAYNCFRVHAHRYPARARFYTIHFDDLEHSYRCNPLAVSTLRDIADAGESARTILVGLNRDWVNKQGDFWAESSISFLTALIWYLRRYKDGKYCTLPHVIELLHVEQGRLLSILRTEPEIRTYIEPFISAYVNQVKETLDNQLASLKIAMARLASPTLYYVMSGNDLSLDINNPAAPKILCIGNSPQRSGIYGAAISLYITTINRLTNKRGMRKSSYIYDEFTSIYVHRINETMATARSNKVATTIAIQDASQLRLNYGRDQAEVILNLPGNVISGQVTGDSARHLSEQIGKIMQDRSSLQVNRIDTSLTRSSQLDPAVPSSRIAKLSTGEFAGIVADDAVHPIEHKAFHGRIIQDNAALDREQRRFRPIPFVRKVRQEQIDQNFQQIRTGIDELVSSELTRMMSSPTLSELVIVNIS